jgi:small-conductance mechanosensitive channel
MNIQEILLDKVTSLGRGIVEAVPLLVLGVLVLLFTGLVTYIAKKVLLASLSSSSVRQSLKDLFATLLKVSVWTVGVLVALTVVFPELTPAKLLTALGLGSVAVGLAFKDIFENFFAGILIMLRKPMRIGDVIECEDVYGKIEHISVRETYIRKMDDSLVMVPNRFLFQNPVNVLTDNDLRRFELVVGVAYGENLKDSRDVILKALQGLDCVNREKPLDVFAREFNSSSVDFTVRWWAASTPKGLHESRDQVIFAIKQALDDAGIEIPFPYRTLTFPEPLTLQRTDPE